MAFKRYEDLEFSDNFAFCKLMSSDPDICKGVLELALGIKVRDVRIHGAEYDMGITADGKGVRLDVFAEDDENNVYDIEMQTVVSSGLAKRSRYYQGVIDGTLIDKGALYSELRRSCVIFICMERPFSKDTPDLPVYTFRNICCEGPHQIDLDDGASKVFLNVATKCDVKGDLRKFYAYLNGGEPDNELTKKIDDGVRHLIDHKEWRAEYMVINAYIQDQIIEGREKGREEGRKEGRKEGLAEGESNMVLKLVAKGKLDITEGAAELSMSVEEFKKMLNAYKSGKTN